MLLEGGILQAAADQQSSSSQPGLTVMTGMPSFSSLHCCSFHCIPFKNLELIALWVRLVTSFLHVGKCGIA